MIYPVLSDSFESNAFIVAGVKACIIDPGINPRRVLSKLEEYNIDADVLINTHCHFDHCGADSRIIGEKGLRLGLHERDAVAVESGDDSLILSSLFGMEFESVCVGLKFKDGDKVDLGGIMLEVLHTPGHTGGSMCLYEPASKSLFTGDTLFRDGVGRTDLPGGSMDDLRASLGRLVELHGRRGVAKIFPGHGHIGRGEDILRMYDLFS
ncbi:MAG: MBL fold metallo-hydrolase [Candidatus Altiarchaeota archaeon]